jgi:hypothetical protein
MNTLTASEILSKMVSLAHREMIAIAANDLAEYDELAGERRRLGLTFANHALGDSIGAEPRTRRLFAELCVCDTRIERDLGRLAEELSELAGARDRLRAVQPLYLFAPDPMRRAATGDIVLRS